MVKLEELVWRKGAFVRAKDNHVVTPTPIQSQL